MLYIFGSFTRYFYICICYSYCFKGGNLEKNTVPLQLFSTTNPTWIALIINPGLCSEKLVTNCVSYDTACICIHQLSNLHVLVP
jgi:hypothetical protein